MSTPHPAKFSPTILEEIRRHLKPEWLVLDPFAGTGRVHSLTSFTVGVEIEPEWAGQHPCTIVGDALHLPFADATFDAVVTSPCYGNRMADHHEARDGSVRMTYRHQLGRPLHPNNSGQLQWGPKYKDFHDEAWREARRVLKPGGLLVLNISDHFRKAERMMVSTWHTHSLLLKGFTMLELHEVKTPRMGFGANRGKRPEAEYVMVFQAPQEVLRAAA